MIALLSGGLFFLFALRLPARVIAPGVTIGPFAVGGLTDERALDFLNSQVTAFEARGLPLVLNNHTVELGSTAGDPSNLELAYQIFDYQAAEAVGAALKIGRTGGLKARWQGRLQARFFGKNVTAPFVFDEAAARRFLKDNFNRFETNPREASFLVVFDEKTPANLEVRALPESPGFVLAYEEIIVQIKDRLEQFSAAPIELALAELPAAVTESDARHLKAAFESLLSRGELILRYEDKKFTIPAAVWAKWVTIVKDAPSPPARLDLSLEAVTQGLKEIAAEVERPVRSQKMELVEGRVKEFQPAQAGLRINYFEARQKFKDVLFGNSAAKEAVLAVERIEPANAEQAAESLGIRELIGLARTNFSGSPANRRLNIKQGAAALNGMLVPPGSSFSTLAALGEIDEAHGYRSELVIKKDKTVPEFGGGLCQVSTTIFRAVLAGGLPVMERQNHSYRVRYYEPAGVDATLYSPRPDFKFLNDTAHYILIQTHLKGDELVFELWGTKDGRAAEATKPKVYNLVRPPEPKVIETVELPVGKKKCLETAHAGADAVFNYTVKYADGTVKSQDFLSHYKPWGEVCLLGVAATSTPVAAD